MTDFSDPLVFFAACCILTVITETAVFRLAGWKDKWGLIIIALTNVITGLVQGIMLSLFYYYYIPPILIIVELIAVWLEFALFRVWLGRDRKLLLVTLIANVLSCAAVFLIHGLS